jgi:hypothetical protein
MNEIIKNNIDVQFCKTLNEANKERIYEHHAKLIIKVQELESHLEQVNVDSTSDFQMTFNRTY